MAVTGIQNIDGWVNRINKLQEACREETRQKALAAAGEVLREALENATPVGAGTAQRESGNAKQNVINVPARPKQYGVARQLVGYAKQAWYMFYREFGFISVGSMRRTTEARAAKATGRVAWTKIPAKPIMRPVFAGAIAQAMDAAREVIRKAAGF